MKQLNFLFFIFLSLTIASCGAGGGSSSETKQDSTQTTDENMSKAKSNLEYLKSLPTEYLQRESLASSQLKQRLEDERRIILEKGLNFTVANTSVSEMRMEDITGAFPVNKKVSDSLVNLMKNNPLPPSAKLGSGKKINSTDETYDPRLVNFLPQIRFQKCGNCWSYSAIGVLELSYIKIHGVLPNTIDLSEKQMVACSGGGDCVGGWPYLVYSYLKKSSNVRVATESKFKDDGKDKPCPPIDLSAKASLSNWGIVDLNSGLYKIAAKSKIKEAIANYGAVSACILATPTFQDFGSTIDGTGVFKDQLSDSTDPQINHAIIIIGWDDNKQAWLIRNSWDSGWGNKGYAWVDYNTNNIGYGAIWCIAK